MLVPQINDSARENMAAVARWYQDTQGTLVTEGSDNAYTLTTNSSHAALGDQSMLAFRADRANTGAATLNVDGLGAKDIRVNHDEALVSGDIQADGIYIVFYNSESDWYEIFGLAVPPDGSITTAKFASDALLLPRGYIDGLVCSNGTDSDHDIDISAGVARDFANSFNFENSSTHVKRIDASWASGSGNGGLASGVSLQANTTYHLFAVDDGSGNTEFGFDTSLTASNLLSDTGGSFYRMIWSVLTDGDSNIHRFTQHHDYNEWHALNLHKAGVSSGSTSGSNVVMDVPTGFKVVVDFMAVISGGTDNVSRYMLFTDPDTSNNAATSTRAMLNIVRLIEGDPDASGQFQVLTDSFARIRQRLDSGSVSLDIHTLGFWHPRGRDE